MSNSESGEYLNWLVKLETGESFFCNRLDFSDDGLGERLLIGGIRVGDVNNEKVKPVTIHVDDFKMWWMPIEPRLPAYWESVMKGAQEL